MTKMKGEARHLAVDTNGFCTHAAECGGLHPVSHWVQHEVPAVVNEALAVHVRKVERS